MREPVYEFTPETSNASRQVPSQWKWLILALIPVVIGAAAWGIAILERKRAEALHRGKFQLEVDFFEKVIVAVAQSPTFNDEDIAALAEYPHLQLLDLSGTDSGSLRELSKFNDLRVLDLRNCSWMGDEQMRWITGMQELKRLDLSGTRITDAGLLALRDVPQLGQLRIIGCREITDDGLAVLAEMDQLRKIWLGKAGYSFDGLLKFRLRRRDINLQLHPSELFWNEGELSGPAGVMADQLTIGNARGFGQHISTQLPTPADAAALKRILQFPQNWRIVQSSQQTPLRTVQDSYESNFLENVEDSWGSLELSGPIADKSLAEIFPLTPKLTLLSFRNTTLSEDFPYDWTPPGLRRLFLENVTVSQSLLQRMTEQTSVEQIEIRWGRVDDAELHSARLGHFITTLQGGNVAGIDQRDIEPAKWTMLQVHCEKARPALDKLLPLVHNLQVLELHHMSLAGDDFPFDQLPPKLQWLHISNAKVNDSFFQELGKHVAVENLVLHRVDVADTDPAGSALGALTSLESLQLNYITINNVDFLDPTLEKLRHKLAEQLTGTWTVILSSLDYGNVIEWGDPPQGWMIHPMTRQPMRLSDPE